MAAKINWHRCGTKLRQCHPMYTPQCQIRASPVESLNAPFSRRLFLAMQMYANITRSSTKPQAQNISQRRHDRTEPGPLGTSVPKIIINNTINLFSKTTISILAISNHDNFRVLFDEIASVYFFGKCIYILALETASPGNQHCANCIGTLSFFIGSKHNLMKIGQFRRYARGQTQTDTLIAIILRAKQVFNKQLELET